MYPVEVSRGEHHVYFKEIWNTRSLRKSWPVSVGQFVLTKDFLGCEMQNTNFTGVVLIYSQLVRMLTDTSSDFLAKASLACCSHCCHFKPEQSVNRLVDE